MKTTVKQWGNSAAVRIPAGVMRAVHFVMDEEVEVRDEAGRIVIEPVHEKSYLLVDLVAKITLENQHAPVDFGLPVGKETW